MLLLHLSAEDFTNLLEGAVVPESRRLHLQSCTRCMDRFVSLQEIRAQVEGIAPAADDFVPEPDWSEFRSDVRNALLSRSVKRENAARSWAGVFGWKPAMAFGLSMLLVFGFLVTRSPRFGESDEPTQIAAIEDSFTEADLNSLESMARSDVFEDLLRLDPAEAESLQMILDDISPEGVSQQ